MSKITQLAKEAGAGNRAGVRGLVFRENELEKFVELIVRECNQRANQYIFDCGEVGCLPEHILEEHFGVQS